MNLIDIKQLAIKEKLGMLGFEKSTEADISHQKPNKFYLPSPVYGTPPIVKSFFHFR